MKKRDSDSGQFQRVPIEERFWEKVDRSDGVDACWLWQGPIEWTGYGRITDYWNKHSVHRFAYELLVGPIPPGKCVCHTCDVRNCVNPKHLWIGSTKENHRDSMTKGRAHQPVGNPLHGIKNPGSKLTDAQVLEIRSTYVPRKTPVRALAAKYGVAPSLIHRVIQGKSWAHL